MPESLRPVEKVWGKGTDILAGIAYGLICFGVLFWTAGDYGITWDEAAPNFVAARNQAEWFGNLFSLEEPFSKETIDKYWDSPSKHPSLTRTLMALSYLAFGDFLGEIVAMRLPSIFLVSLLVSVMYIWLSRTLNCIVALGSIIVFITLPRVFGHAHIASLDVPMMVWWALVAISFYQGAQRPLISRWHVLTGILYGLALSTKLHSFFLPFPLLAWMLINKRKEAWRGVLSMAVLGPVIYFLTQVFLWYNTWPRLMTRLISYGTKDVQAPVRIYFFDRIIEETPLHYPLVMLLMTTTAVTLFFLVLGAIGLFRVEPKSGLRSLIVLNIIVPMFLIVLPHAQGYDGIRLILPAMPWLGVLGGIGLATLVEWLRALFRAKGEKTGKLIWIACLAILFVPNARELRRVHPFHLEYFADWLGGIPGGRRLGMESTYWCNTIQPELLEVMNRTIPDGAKLRPLAMSYDVLESYQRLGMLKPTIIVGGDPPYDYHLLQCRQGFFGRTEWAFYSGRMGPAMATVSYRSVPFMKFFAPLPKL